MSKFPQEKHNQHFPTARKIRRSCNKELYRTIKKLKVWIPPDQIAAAEKLYYQKVILNLVWIAEHESNRKLLSDWWEENVCPEIAVLWNVEPSTLSRVFRETFGG